MEFVTEEPPNSGDSLSSMDGAVRVVREPRSLWIEGPSRLGCDLGNEKGMAGQCNLESITGKDENSHMSVT